MNAVDIARTIESLVAARAGRGTVCPSEVAHALAGPNASWRPLMIAVRTVAADLARRGRLSVTRRGAEVDALSVGGPIRLGRPRCACPGQTEDPSPC